MDLGAHIASKKLTVSEWAKLHGFPVGTVIKWVRRERVPRAATMPRVCAACEGEVTPSDFFAETSAAEHAHGAAA